MLDAGRLVAIHAPADDQVVVVREDGAFGRVTPEGLQILGEVEGATAIAVWGGRIWIGAGANGLWRAGGGELVCVRDDRPCVGLEAHADSLLVACSDIVCSTDDGERFPGGCRGALEPLRLQR